MYSNEYYRLEELQNHQNEDVYNKSVKLLETYFGAEEEDENIAPNVNNNSANAPSFSFGSNVQYQYPGGFAF